MPGYMSVYSWVSPATAAIRFWRLLPIGSPVAGSPTCFQKLEVAVRMAGLAFGGGPEQRRDVVLALDVGLVREVQVAAVGLRFAGERVLQVLLGLRTFQAHDLLLVVVPPAEVRDDHPVCHRSKSPAGKPMQIINAADRVRLLQSRLA